ncbi:F-box protein At1g67340-like [Cicer arietinum]|uniref:F-box protein At1g67340-like n=1 Tax=Cicer arietinum TaxID=3827 RepID=A0A1S2YBG9_CICAR|nr:F-box protein At1g67340-like [Cicer arietinum]
MRTRTGLCYPQNMSSNSFLSRKKQKTMPEKPPGVSDLFESLPDDLVLSILGKLSSTANSPSDFITVLITCKRLKSLGLSSIVLSKASNKTLSVKAKNWCDSAHRFLKRCVDAGNTEACYTLGMVRTKNKIVILVFLPAYKRKIGHIDGLRELGHCLQDGYGVKQNVIEGRRFLVQANARELAAVLSNGNSKQPLLTWSINPNQPPQPQVRAIAGSGCPLLSDFGCNVPAPEAHPASKFMTEWFAIRGGFPGSGMRLCSHSGCGRPETRKHEFRRCSVCGAVNYCSRACQALDWKFRHKVECAPVERWLDEEVNGAGEVNGAVNVEEVVVVNR